ncbi:MAG: GtrA family protein [Rudaea sp.]
MGSYTDGAVNDNQWRHVGRFLGVGMLGTLVDMGLFSAMRLGLHWPVLMANTLAYSAGIVNNYLLHRNWSFSDREQKAVRVQFVQFAAVSLSALVVNNLIVLFLSPVLGSLLFQPALSDLIAKAAATLIGVGWNLALNSAWTFAGAERERQR